MGKACYRKHTPWHTCATSEVCKISHVLIALKWLVVIASSVGVYDEFSVHCLLFLPIFNNQSIRKYL